MKKFLRTAFSLILTLSLLFGAVPLGGFGVFASAEKPSVLFGSYPQSRVTDADTLAALDAAEKQWVSYGYYSGTDLYDGNMAPSDYMRYAELSYNGERYRAVTFSKYRSYYTMMITGTDGSASCQDENGYFIDQTYYFKYEPLRWTILDADEGLILCENILDAQAYCNYTVSQAGALNPRYFGDPEQTFYANNYERSSIRAWLNDDFYNTAFSAEQQPQIQTTHIETAWPQQSSSVNYACADTDDKIFLLSYWDALNESYGFSALEDASASRQIMHTDYALCQGLYLENDSAYAQWTLRTPGFNSFYVYSVKKNGSVTQFGCYTSEVNGIRPAMRLQNYRDYICTHNYEITAQNEDTHTFACSLCGSTYSQAHSYAVTSHTKSVHTETCSVCGRAVTSTHQFENGVCTVCDTADQSIVHNGDTVSFGQYPQSRVTDETILSALNGMQKTWVSYGYYSNSSNAYNGNMQPGEFMQYADLAYHGERYRAVTFSRYRPYSTANMAYPFGAVSYQDENGYGTDQVYYFKFEPLQWKVLDADQGLAVCVNAVDAQPYNNCIKEGASNVYWGNSEMSVYASDYAHSSLRAWLNDDFCNTAFSGEEQSMLLTADQNGEESDPVCLLSRDELLNEDYGFSASADEADTARAKTCTDYALCQGCFQNTDTGCSYWWTRTPYDTYGANILSDQGSFSADPACRTEVGVVPAIRIESLRFECLTHTFTCVETSKKTHTLYCSVCDSTYVRAHTYEQGVCTVCGVRDPQDPDHAWVDFGSYPQTRVTDETTISALNDIEKSWTSFGYYAGTGSDGEAAPSDFMRYADIALNGEKYRAVTFSAFRPNRTDMIPQAQSSAQESHGAIINGFSYEANTVYYFKYEPLSWRVLDPASGLVMCNRMIDSQPYQNTMYHDTDHAFTYQVPDYNESIDYYLYYNSGDCTELASDYASSSIRAWLNADFYNTAFTEEEKRLIFVTHVNNNEGAEMNYALRQHPDTDDKIFLLSLGEVTNPAYGFSAGEQVMNGAKDLDLTDYMCCQGGYYDYGSLGWMTRTPCTDFSIYDAVTANEHMSAVNGVLGVVPAMRVVQLPGFDCIHEYTCTDHDTGAHILTCEFCGDTREAAHTFENGVCTVCGQAEIITARNGDTVTFGQYPQSRVTDAATLSALDAIEKTWVSYGYYSGNGSLYHGTMTPGNFMKYADLTYNGAQYRAVLITGYRPNITSTPANDPGFSEQDNNGYTLNTVYYFKFEPIEWVVLDAAEGLVIAKNGIDAQPFNNFAIISGSDNTCFGSSAKTFAASDYANSSIRQWLNDQFFNAAFSPEEQARMQVSQLEPNVSDSVFLLSESDLLNPDYGFSTSRTAQDAEKVKDYTDYALSQGCLKFNDVDKAHWHTRTATASDRISVVTSEGAFTEAFTYMTGISVVPAIKIKYLQNKCTQHTYEDGICTFCGAGHGFAAAKNTDTTVDGSRKMIYGLRPHMTASDLLHESLRCSNDIVMECSSETVGTGTVVTLRDAKTNEVIDSYEIVIFGDTDGDGIYDGQDAFIVSCIASGMLTREQVGEAAYLAADCNHDGIVDTSDVLLLEQAGLMLANIDQSQADYTETDAYAGYLSLIDQNPSADEDIAEEPDEPAPETLLQRIVGILQAVILFIRSLIPML